MALRTVHGVWLLPVGALLLAGCGTTRFTDTTRSATEMLLLSKAVDDSLKDIDFRPLAGKTVFLEEKYLENVQDKQYLISALRQQLLASGAYLQEERPKATYVVEARAGALATDRSSLLFGVPAIALPSFGASPVPIPSAIPEIPFAKSTDQRAFAKVAVFAYNRLTGRPVLQSGVVQADANSEDLWVFGLGPFQRGSIRPKTEFNGTPVALPFFGESETDEPAFTQIDSTHPATWSEATPAATANRDVKPPETKPATAATPAPVPPAPAPPPASNFAADRPPPVPTTAPLPSSLVPPIIPASFVPR